MHVASDLPFLESRKFDIASGLDYPALLRRGLTLLVYVTGGLAYGESSKRATISFPFYSSTLLRT